MSIASNILLDYLYKKALGAPQTNANTDIEAELAYSSIPHIFQSQNYAQHIPISAPDDWIPSGSNVQWSAQYPYIYKYTGLTLLSPINGNNTVFNHPSLINIIPRSYNQSYRPSLTTSTGDAITGIPLILDPDSGILLFTQAYPPVSIASPPKITFYSYVGLIGNPGIANLQVL
jgi:hypothetical protein